MTPKGAAVSCISSYGVDGLRLGVREWQVPFLHPRFLVSVLVTPALVVFIRVWPADGDAPPVFSLTVMCATRSVADLVDKVDLYR